MKVGLKKTVDVDVTTIDMYLKLRDEMAFLLKDSDGETVLDYEGYVPNSIIPGEFGDYMHLVIDIETGQITNWKKPTAKDVQDLIEENS
jgi:hypothetical protein